MQPHPVSDVNPVGSTSWLRKRTASDIDDSALGSCDLGMMGKPERYVSHILASKSSKNEAGHPPSSTYSDSEYANCESTLLDVLSGGVAGGSGRDGRLPINLDS